MGLRIQREGSSAADMLKGAVRTARGSARSARPAYAVQTPVWRVGELHQTDKTSQDLRSRNARPIEQRPAFRIRVGVDTCDLPCPLLTP